MLCKLCKTDFASQRRLIAHCKEMHLSKDGFPTLICPFDQCDRTYDIPDSFRSHLKSHCNESSEQSKQSVSYYIPMHGNVLSVESNVINAQISNEEGSQSCGNEVSEEAEDYISNDDATVATIQLADSNLCTHKENFERSIFLQMIDLLADDSLPRKKAINTVRNLHSVYVGMFRAMLNHFTKKQVGDAESTDLLTFLLDPKLILSEYQIVQRIQRLNCNVAQKTILLDSKYNMVTKRPSFHIMKVFNLPDLFSKLFNLPDFFNDVLRYIDSLNNESEWISNVIQSPYWKKVKSSLNLKNNEIALPLYVYNDDFEPLNVLGSHRGAYKISGVYVYLPCLPPEVQSKLEYIFASMIFFSTDRSSYGNGRVFTPLIDELNKLQTDGINIEHKTYNLIKIIPIVLLGDNLGLNTMMGFVQCFVANFYCRICICHKREMATADVADPTKRRTNENYEKHCKINNPALTGIAESNGSVWNTMHNFHVVNNLCVDIMHDLFEGACHIVLCEILYAFIYRKKYFTLDDFNRRLKRHKFGPTDTNTNIALVTAKMIGARKLNTSASEMLLLFTNFAFMVGDLVPEETREWSVYVMLRGIISVVLQKKIHKNTHYLLKDLVSEHHIEFQNVFQKRLTPKLHFMTHYPNILEELGPICGISSMRFESFHCIFKHIIKNNNCRKDILESCFFKIRMRYASMFLKFKSIVNTDFVTGKKNKVLATNILKKFRCTVDLNEFIFTTKFVESHSVKLKVGHVVKIRNEDDESPVFAIIDEIILNNDKILIGYQLLSNIGFSDHFNAYKVEYENYFFIEVANFDTKPNYVFEGKGNIRYVNTE